MFMKIRSSKFIKSAVRPDGYPDLGLPEIAFAGKSNVGKSSLINKLLNRRSLAKTSSTPGKTRLINFFLINESFVFVDLPGYGYAAVSKSERKSWAPMMEKYFSTRKELKGVVLLQDIRRDISDMDRRMIDLVSHYHLPLILVLTKSDKFSRNQRTKRFAELRKKLPPLCREPVFFSSLSGLGKEDLGKAIMELMEYDKLDGENTLLTNG